MDGKSSIASTIVTTSGWSTRYVLPSLTIIADPLASRFFSQSALAPYGSAHRPDERTAPRGHPHSSLAHGLLDRASDQGVLIHLVAEAELRRRFEDVYLLPGVDVSARSGPEEVDLFGVCGGRLIVGEAKTSADQFTPSQIERDVGLAAALGADRVVLACAQVIPTAARRTAEGNATEAGLTIEFVDPESSGC